MKHKETNRKIVIAYNHTYRTIITLCSDYDNLEAGNHRLLELEDADILPKKHCRTDATADWIVDGQSGLPYTGRFKCRFVREGNRVYANLTKETLN